MPLHLGDPLTQLDKTIYVFRRDEAARRPGRAALLLSWPLLYTTLQDFEHPTARSFDLGGHRSIWLALGKPLSTALNLQLNLGVGHVLHDETIYGTLFVDSAPFFGLLTRSLYGDA